ncbi:AtpZ/AtpI family protein [uncultured Sphingomonas sp.]|uniref:AtpZ/AtpI family protein n=1 Tax=uncultured Sphingomonas sp. TaxID=158754 RepID=UPI0025FBFF92|nr:AtpZ/AtpI family protein [uncultured Sphingomonas sp.]
MAEEEPGQDPKLPPDARLDRLEQRLERAQREEAVRTGQGATADANEQLGNRVLSYLLGGLLGGALIGWLLDELFDTGHLLLVVGLVLGTVGGFWSIIKLSMAKTKDDLSGR